MKYEGRECDCGCVVRYASGHCVDCATRISSAYQSANRDKINARARQATFNKNVCGPKITKAQARRGLSISEFMQFISFKAKFPEAFAR